MFVSYDLNSRKGALVFAMHGLTWLKQHERALGGWQETSELRGTDGDSTSKKKLKYKFECATPSSRRYQRKESPLEI